MGGLHPVVAIYSTFLNRAFDQLLMDVALHRCGVTFVLDRAGITGPDGASHHGMWDISILQLVPGLHLAAPAGRHPAAARRWRGRCRSTTRPSVLRFSKDQVPAGPAAAVDQVDGLDVLLAPSEPRVLVVGFGPLARIGVAVGERLADQGIGVTRGRPGLGAAGQPRAGRAGRRARAGDHPRGRRHRRRLRRPAGPGDAARRGAYADPRVRPPAGSSSTTAAGPSCWPRPG